MKTRRGKILFFSSSCVSLLLALTTIAAFVKQPAWVTSLPSQDAQLLQFTAGGHILGFSSSGVYAATGSHALHVDFMGAKNVQPQAESPGAEGKAAPLSRVQYPNLWQGISLRYDAPSGGILRSTYQLEVGADVSAIQLRYNAPLTVKADGSLSIAFETGTLNESAPLAWQVINGKQVVVAVSFTQQNNEVGFALEQYDARYPLTIDPTLTWNTFLGGSGYDWGGNAIAVDISGNVYVAGNSGGAWGCSPVSCTVRAFDPAPSNYQDAFVAKLDSSGALKWNTFLGGSGGDSGSAIAVDTSGNVYVAGNSNGKWGCSPVSCTVRDSNGGAPDFVAKLNSSDGVLQWNTFLDGLLSLYGTGIALDGSGNIYVAGRSGWAWGCSPVDCTVRPFTSGLHYWESDAYVAMLNSSGVLQWNTFLGGSGDDYGRGIAVDGHGNIYATGLSHATWGAPVRAFTIGDDSIHDYPDAFAAKLNSSGALQWNTFLGGSGDEEGYDGYGGIAVDEDSNAYVVGDSSSPWGCAPAACTVRPFTLNNFSQADAFVAKVDSSGVLQWNTFLGGHWDDAGNAITVDGVGNVYVVGTSSSTWGSPLREFTSGDDAFAAKLNSSGALQWNSFLGAPGTDFGNGIAVDSGGNVYVGGESGVTWGAPVRAFDYDDVFVAKLSYSLSANANLSNLVFSTGALTPGSAADTTAYTQSVANTVTSLTVTPTVADAAASVTVNGTPVTSGIASGPISLALGPNTITTVVTAEDGITTRTYTVTVTRAYRLFLPLLQR